MLSYLIFSRILINQKTTSTIIYYNFDLWFEPEWLPTHETNLKFKIEHLFYFQWQKMLTYSTMFSLRLSKLFKIIAFCVFKFLICCWNPSNSLCSWLFLEIVWLSLICSSSHPSMRTWRVSWYWYILVRILSISLLISFVWSFRDKMDNLLFCCSCR